MALLMVGFLIGGSLTRDALRGHGATVLRVSLAVVVASALFVFVGLLLLGVTPAVALVLAGAATSTAPAATADVVREVGAEGPFTTTLLGIVAIDDAWGLLLFTMCLVVASSLGGEVAAIPLVAQALWEIGGAVGVGIAIGVPMSFLTGRVEPGEPTQAEALGAVLLCGGIALGLGVSFLLSAIVLGTVVANLAQHHSRPFRAIEGIEWPFLVLFFILSGASLGSDSLQIVGPIVVVYVVARALGRFVGGPLGARDRGFGFRIALGLMPQAGVALGMGLVAAERFPEHAQVILATIVAGTAFFELTGPVLARWAIKQSGEA